MTNIRLSRYEQHIELPNVGVEGQEKIFNSKVLIVGAGGLGCPISLYLTAAGVGHIGIVDADCIEESNLQRQVLFGNDDVGREKVVVVKEQLSKRAHNQIIKIHNVFLNKENVEGLIQGYDVVVDATDNHQARLAINEACLKQKKAWVYGALYHFEGQIMVFNGGERSAPCFKCVFSDIDENSSLPTCKSAGVLSTIPGVIGCFQATDVLKLILGLNREDEHSRLKIINTLTYDVNNIMTTKRENCSVCREYD